MIGFLLQHGCVKETQIKPTSVMQQEPRKGAKRGGGRHISRCSQRHDEIRDKIPRKSRALSRRGVLEAEVWKASSMKCSRRGAEKKGAGGRGRGRLQSGGGGEQLGVESARGGVRLRARIWIPTLVYLLITNTPEDLYS